MTQSLKVAVIGAGPGGLTSARELKKEGHEVVVYEKSNQIGGIWAYDPRVEEDDLIGLDPNRKIVHGSVYNSLRTNMPRCLMGFPDYPFPPKGNGHVSNYPSHAEVLDFLKGYVREFGLAKIIKLNTHVVRVEQVSIREKLMWLVESRRCDVEDDDSLAIELFEAVVVCNGHTTQPKITQLPGIHGWPGKQIHSHNYRVPEPYRDQVVVMIGSGSSAYQICEQVCSVAKEVHLVSKWPGTIPSSKVEMFHNVWLHCKVDYCYKNGEVAFDDGATVIAADTILYCTGYKYSFPFLKTNGIVNADNNRVGHLYKHVFSPQFAPTLSFVGIPTWAPIFLMVYYQAKWIAQVLSGKAILPSKQEMMDDVEQHYKLMEQNGVPKHHTHSLAHYPTTFEYLNWLSLQVGVPPEVEMKEIYEICAKAVFTRGFWSGFRDYIDAQIESTT